MFLFLIYFQQQPVDKIIAFNTSDSTDTVCSDHIFHKYVNFYNYHNSSRAMSNNCNDGQIKCEIMK